MSRGHPTWARHPTRRQTHAHLRRERQERRHVRFVWWDRFQL